MRGIRRVLRFGILGAALTGAAACNRYDVYLVAGFQQESFSNDADVVFVIDNSDSMADESEALALNFDAFINDLVSGTAGQGDGLVGAVNTYVGSISDRARLVDFQLAITTTTIDTDAVPGAQGALIGGPDTRILSAGMPDLADAFITNLLCEATCWRESDLPSDPNYTCGDPYDQVTLQVLDCVCGESAWEGNCGSGNEEGLEASLEVMCRASDNPPAECWDDIRPLTEDDAGTNAGLLREDSTAIFVIVTDEGDNSRMLPVGVDDPTDYLDLMDRFNHRYRYAVIGPDYDPDTQAMVCNSGGAQTWQVARYQNAVEATDGFYSPIAEDADPDPDVTDCQETDFSVHLNELGKLLNALLTAFPLQSVPDVDTITVFVDGFQVDPAPQEVGPDGQVTYGDGWSYNPALNAVEFHGDAIPDYNQEVRIYYKPLEGNPRELPF